MTEANRQQLFNFESAEAPQKDPDDWVTGDEPMTRAQASYLRTLCAEAHQVFDGALTKAEASKRIEHLQDVTGRGRHAAWAP